MKKICVVTSTRADYGIISNLIKRIDSDPELELQLLVTGSHLSKKFGYTCKEITSPIAGKVDIEIEQNPHIAMSIAIKKFYEVFNELKPDIVVLFADRYETLAVAIAAMLANFPIMHIGGGEASEGVIDEYIRHSITKMSHLHCVICEEYRNRVIQLGEDPKFVFNVGSLAVENIEKTQLLSKGDLEKKLNFIFGEKNLLVTFQPETLETGCELGRFKELIDALSELKDTKIIFTMPNSDDGNDTIFGSINDYVSTHSNAVVFTSLGMLLYFSTVQFVDGVVGNSSSGITEAPSFKIGTINIGDRQRGRIQSKSIINCDCSKESVLNALDKLYSAEFQAMLKNVENVYKSNNTANRIAEILKTFDGKKILMKRFYKLKTV
ncbi:MAG: UDP-N-acetylglucosamine 2-epimerase [Holosporales bacterium]|jgi:GDP/UDP-N,N'-diacetylbacillosamine 2-epimerase (hydrolysing)|nr:UDP-N-acetylglucosamine 2-epimerase [Holosporales bacterium]